MMRSVLLAGILLLSISAWAGPRRHQPDHDAEAVPVVVDREEFLGQIEDLDAELMEAMKRAKRVRPLVESLRRTRAQLNALREQVATSPAPREWWRSQRDPYRYFDPRTDLPAPPPAQPPHGSPQTYPPQPPPAQPYPPSPPTYPPSPPQTYPPPAQPYPPQTYPPAPQPPPGQPVVYPMQDAAFQKLVKAVREQSFSRERLRVLSEAASTQWFLVAQARKLLEQFDFSQDKLSAVRVLNPRILDRDNLYQLYGSFEFSNDKAELQKILAQPLGP